MTDRESFLDKLPVQLLPTMTGVLTLSNLYYSFGHPIIRHLSMGIVSLLMIAYIVKVIRKPQAIRQAYQDIGKAVLFSGFMTTLMILGNYLTNFNHSLGQALWLVAIILHAVHIIIFTVKYLKKFFMKKEYLPTWSVTYSAITVCVAVGEPMGFESLQRGITIYCLVAYFLMLVTLLIRFKRIPIQGETYHSQAILLAPISLCVVGYLRMFTNPNPFLMTFLALCFFATLFFVYSKIAYFLAFHFSPSFAGLTFPMSIGTVAIGYFTDYSLSLGYSRLADGLTHLQHIQFYLTTILVGYVFIRFLGDLFHIDSKVKDRYYH